MKFGLYAQHKVAPCYRDIAIAYERQYETCENGGRGVGEMIGDPPLPNQGKTSIV